MENEEINKEVEVIDKEVKNDKKKSKPICVFKSGSIKLNVWENEGKNRKKYSFTASRTYNVNGRWGESKVFGEPDILKLAQLLKLAWDKYLSKEENEETQ